MKPSYVKCACQECCGPFEIPVDYIDTNITCPHCQTETICRPPMVSPSLYRIDIFIGLAVSVAVGLSITPTPAPTDPVSVAILRPVFASLLVALALAIYFIPTLMAKKNRSAILVLNLFLGWTFLGWVIALVWAVKD
jgi:hypothetical protein